MAVEGVYAQDVEQWKRELRAAGWVEESSTVWESPRGLRYRGPFKAWCIMKGVPCEIPECPACGHRELYHFDDGFGNIVCRATRDCQCIHRTESFANDAGDVGG